MPSEDQVYRAIGKNIRKTRERIKPRLSQTQLSKDLGVSRVSVVNIEAGRQHAPLYLLWRIAEQLGTELALLVPRQDELALPEEPDTLDEETVTRIRSAAAGDLEAGRQLIAF